MENENTNPNFFCSIPYWGASGSQVQYSQGSAWLETDGVCLLPPCGPLLPDFIWSDYLDFNPGPEWTKEFLDWEYLYNPKAFLNLSGKKWRKFRKNTSKWISTHPQYEYSRNPPNSDSIKKLLLQWFEKVGLEHVQDSEIIYEMTVSNKLPGLNKKFITENGVLLGINIWDTNYQYINYRFCISTPDEPFLDEFMRLAFYTDPEIIRTGKLVNDGGSLGNKNLEWFKDKLNPESKRPVYSWRRN